MSEEIKVTSERVDDIPLLIAQLERMGVQFLLDEYFPTHGNWQGLSLGWVVVVWLTHILSEADHRLNHVQRWAEKRLKVLSQSTGQEVRGLDFSDDRLGDVLRDLSEDQKWKGFEGALSGRLLRVYDLEREQVRIDTTTANGYWEVTQEGLFQFGHSKDHRPDLPQVKVAMAALDPMGMPIVTEVVSGNRADDPLYIPTIKQVRESLKQRGVLYVADGKMGALQSRAYIQAGGDLYLCPLSEVQMPDEELHQHIAEFMAKHQPLTPVYREDPEAKPELIAEGFQRVESLRADVLAESICWEERQLILRSIQAAQAGEKSLRQRLEKAKEAVIALNERGRGKRRYTQIESLQEGVEAILKKYRVEGVVEVSYEQQERQRRVRSYGERPERVEEQRDITVQVTVNPTALKQALQGLGWRVYVTNAWEERLSLNQAVWAYRSEYIIERGFSRFKGHPLSLSPMYLEREDHVTGLIRLLSIGLRGLTLLEFVVRADLASRGVKLAGLYAGNPRRATARPTAELLLEAFKDLTLTLWKQGDQILSHLTPLSSLQRSILASLNFPLDIYTKLCVNSLNST